MKWVVSKFPDVHPTTSRSDRPTDSLTGGLVARYLGRGPLRKGRVGIGPCSDSPARGHGSTGTGLRR